MLASLLGARQISSPQALTAFGDWGGSTTETWSGKPVTPSSALQHLTVYGCNRFICDGISTLPVDVYRKGSDGSAVPVTTPAVLEMPAPYLDIVSWLTQVLTSLLIAGNFYGFRQYSGGLTPDAVVPIDPTSVQVNMDRGRKVFVINGDRFSSFEILHVPGVMFPGSLVGMSPVEAARQTIGAGMSAQEFGAKFFGQGTTLSGVIEVPHELTPEQATRLASAWARKHGSASKSHLPGVLEGGSTWKPTQLSNEQSQFLETRQYTASEIAAQLFLIDPAEMGLPVAGSSLTYTNQEQRNIRKVQVTFLPWIVRLEKAMSSLTPRGQYVKLNVSGLLRGDTTARFAAYATGIASQFLVPNEARKFEDWSPLEGGDEVVETAPPASTPGG